MTNHAFLRARLWPVFVLILASQFILRAQETKITKEELPPAVVSAFEKAYPNAVIKDAGKVTKDKKTYYEIESIEGSTNRDLLYTSNGKVLEIEEAMKSSALPPEVVTSLKKEYPKVIISKAEKVTRDTVVSYELDIKVGKLSKEVAFDSNGNLIKKKTAESEKDEKDGEEDDD